MQVNKAVEKMIGFYKGDYHDIGHFLKVYAFARTIGEGEGLPSETQELVELAAVIHDIACPLCRKKYGNADGKKQELESPSLVAEFLAEFELPQESVRRLSWLVAHHHTYTAIGGIDHQILLEADYLVNAGEGSQPETAIRRMLEQVFRTATGKKLLCAMYLREKE